MVASTVKKTKVQRLFAQGKLPQRAEAAKKLLRSCNLCPRQCGVDRLSAETGICQTGRHALIASYGPHFGEEAPLVGSKGSGTIFFGGCSLLCTFCQNYTISHDVAPCVPVDAAQLATIMLELQEQGCHNINLVTPSHVVPQILAALALAVPKGLAVPIVYNSSGYDNAETLHLLDGVVDIYMPDFKFWSPKTAKRYAGTPDYPKRAQEALAIMHAQTGDLQLSEQGIAAKGVLVRHLLMPALGEETRSILTFIANEISKDTYINIMDQYRPCGKVAHLPELQRSISSTEYRQALEAAGELGLTRLDQRDFGELLKKLAFFE